MENLIENVDIENEEVLIKNLEPKLVKGYIIGTSNLRVRRHPSKKAEVVTIIDNRTLLNVDVNNSTKNFYKVQLKVLGKKYDGFVVKEYVEVYG